jgi:PAS domain-containing protein
MSKLSDSQPSIEVTLRETAAALSAVLVQDALNTASHAARAGRYDEAADVLTPIVRTKAPPLSVLDLLARVEAQRGRADRAAFLWERALEIDADNERAVAGLACVTHGNRRAARIEESVVDLLTNEPALVIASPTGSVLGWSDAATALFGWSESLGQLVSVLFTKKHARLDARDVRDVLRGRAVIGARVHCVRRNHAEFSAYCDLTTVVDARGAVVGVRRTVRAAP